MTLINIKKRNLISISIILSLVLLFLFFSIRDYLEHNIISEYGAVISESSHDYTNTFGDNKEFEIGININDNPIFKNKDEAFDKLCNIYSDTLNEMSNRYHLRKITKYNWRQYKLYSNELVSVKEYIEDSNVISSFFDIYSNSFE